MISLTTWVRGSETVPAVDGRELYKALAPGRDFSSWVSSRIQSFNYQDGEDFACHMVERGAATPAKEYLLSLPMAAEICLLDRSEKGRELRRFILESWPVQSSPCEGGKCTDERPMWELSQADLQANVLKACRKCHTPFTAAGEICSSCQQFERDQASKAALVRQRNMQTVTENELVQCLIDREGDTTITVPGTLGVLVSFRRNSLGHAVARIQNPDHRARVLKSQFFRSYEPKETA